MTITTKRIAHVTLNVAAINTALKFLIDKLGLVNRGHFQVAGEDGLAMGIDGQVKWWGYRFNSPGYQNATEFQLVEWERPITRLPPYQKAHNAGISRLAVKVPNLDEIYHLLIDHGVEVFAPPQINDTTGEHFFCSLNRDGSMYEFIEDVGEPELWFININCSNLDAAIEWYGRLGLVPVSERWQQETSGRPYGIAGRVIFDTVRLQLPHQQADCGIQLQQWLLPATADSKPYERIDNMGFARFTIEVDDVHEAYQRLVAAGVHFTTPPVMFDAQQGVQEPWVVFVQDPDGTYIGLVENESLG